MWYPGKELRCGGSKGMCQVEQEYVKALTGIWQGSNTVCNEESRKGKRCRRKDRNVVGKQLDCGKEAAGIL
jgi:hypothetical protein